MVLALDGMTFRYDRLTNLYRLIRMGYGALYRVRVCTYLKPAKGE
jgi:hypothetical protein